MRIGRNMWGCPLIATGTFPDTERKYLTVNEGGRWFSALWIFGSQLILALNALRFIGTVHWRVGQGWKPEVVRIET